MARPSIEGKYRMINAALALAEERGSISLADAAAQLETTRDHLRALLDSVLFLEFRTRRGELVHATRAFLLTEDDHLLVDERHWLRDLVSRPPDADTALRLLVAGTVVQSLVVGANPQLDTAVHKLEQVVAADVVVGVDDPPCRDVVEQARRDGRSVRFRYVNDKGEARDREVEPWFVFSNWGRWYVHGRDLDDDAVKWFRIDRMASADVGDHRFEPPEHAEVPEWFDLHDHEVTVTLRLAATALDGLPTPHRLGAITHLADGRVDVDVTVYGRQRLAHLLVVLPPDAEVVGPEECRALRREHAAALLAGYDG
ncbi:MAG TPA: WYL domain-containing protein [Acidimicrobiia bacterium]|nr:WYL domain-containing protein [Acidimicrobiia bacterium]